MRVSSVELATCTVRIESIWEMSAKPKIPDVSRFSTEVPKKPEINHRFFFVSDEYDQIDIESDKMARLEADLDDHRDDILSNSGLEQLRNILPSKEFRALEQFLVYPIYDLVDSDGKKQSIEHFREAVTKTVQTSAYMNRAAKLFASREQDLQEQLTHYSRVVNICFGVIGTLIVGIL